MSEATEAQQDVYDAIQEIGTAMTFTTFVRVNDTTTGNVTETPTEYANVKASPPQRKSGYDGDTLIPREYFAITLPALNLAFTPVKGMDVALGSDNYRVNEVHEARLQDQILAYDLRTDLLGAD